MLWLVCGGLRTALGPGSSFHHVGSRDLTQAVRLGGKCLCPLGRLTDSTLLCLLICPRVPRSQWGKRFYLSLLIGGRKTEVTRPAEVTQALGNRIGM